jgi:hypothetical protein
MAIREEDLYGKDLTETKDAAHLYGLKDGFGRALRLAHTSNKNMNLNETFIQESSPKTNASPNNHRLFQNGSFVISSGDSSRSPNHPPSAGLLNASYVVDKKTGTEGQSLNNVHNMSYVVDDGRGGEPTTTTTMTYPRRTPAAHNLSFTVERHEDTSNSNNTLGLPTAHDLNRTFDLGVEDHLMMGVAGSNGSVNNVSLEELHTKARRQEECELVILTEMADMIELLFNV